MKEKLTSDFKGIITSCLNWAKFEVEYVKLSAAEKLTVFLTAVMICSLSLLVGMVILIILALCLIDVFKIVMQPWLACLCVGGILIVLMALVLIFRTQLIVNPISRFVTRLFIEKK